MGKCLFCKQENKKQQYDCGDPSHDYACRPHHDKYHDRILNNQCRHCGNMQAVDNLCSECVDDGGWYGFN